MIPELCRGDPGAPGRLRLPPPYLERDGVTVYHGDARALVPLLEAPDVVLTDPPYGVELGSVRRSEKMSKHGNDGYELLQDSPGYVSSVVVPLVELLRGRADRVVLTPGSRCLFLYPPPDALWAVYYPNGAGIGRWRAFTCWQPILCYGSAPPGVGVFPDTFPTTEQAEINGHPCPKPIGLWREILRRVAGPSDLVLDPFMGSGTTLIAARELGLRAIGVDVSERYCEIAAKRLDQGLLPFGEIA